MPKDALKRLIDRFKESAAKIREKTELFITLATPHEGSHISDDSGGFGPYGEYNSGKHESANFFLRTWFMQSMNEKIMTPESIYDECPKLTKFIVTGGRIQYGSPLYILFLKGNEMSFDQPYWTSGEHAYKDINDNDLVFFNHAGVSKGIFHEWGFEEEGKESFKDYKRDNITINRTNPNLKLPDLNHYVIDADSAVRLDSALLYHYWYKDDIPFRKKYFGSKFPDPHNKQLPQTFVLNHADMKAPVIMDEICKNPTQQWEKDMIKKIRKDNEALLKFIKDTIGNLL